MILWKKILNQSSDNSINQTLCKRWLRIWIINDLIWYFSKLSIISNRNINHWFLKLNLFIQYFLLILIINVYESSE